MRKVFDLATKLIGETLDLSLVYLTAVVPHGESNELGRTLIISGHNIPPGSRFRRRPTPPCTESTRRWFPLSKSKRTRVRRGFLTT
ncbi:hypothetical protein Pst134EB_002068 [Puccinia striiformis f. sp. tritici]|nr:hypothetical protein Pst134EB_002068 [Puccinia striiformis f. sp. tritici]